MRAKFQGEFLDSSVEIGVDRLALLRSWVPGLIALNAVTSQPVSSDAAQDWAYAKIRYARRSSRNSDSHRLIEWHMLSIIADCFLLSHGLERSMRMCQSPPCYGARELMPQLCLSRASVSMVPAENAAALVQHRCTSFGSQGISV